jgi:hyaluronoglucosaminidase
MRKFACVLAFIMLFPLLSSCKKQIQEEDTISKVDISGAKDTVVYPVVQESKVSDKAMELHSVSIQAFPGADELICKKLRTVFEKHGIREEANAAVTVYIGSDTAQMGKYLSAFDTTIDDIEQGYTLCAGGSMLLLGAKDTDGLFYAVVTLDALIQDNKIKECIIKDYPTIKERGIIEGFYGEPWSHEDRLSIIDFMGRMKLNTYIYAPKDDLKHRDNWREPYNEEELNRFGELLAKCEENNVKFIFAVSPGKDFNYNNSDADYKALEEKCRTLSDIGVKDFAIFLDDLNKNMQNAQGHAALLNRFQSEFCGETPLITVFSEYFEGAITDRYTGEIAKLLDKRIKVMWTGNDVVPSTMKKDDLMRINNIYDRKMLIWWNYPVNDYAPNNLFIGPATGLDTKLSESICGFIANPMNQAEASKIPLFTMADYIWNPKSYKAASSYDAALKAFHPETADALKKVCSILSGNIINNYTDSTEYKRLLDKLYSISANEEKVKETANELTELFEGLLQAVEAIRSKEINNNFLDEISPWLNKTKEYADKSLLLLEALQNSSGNREASYKAFLEYLKLSEEQNDNKAVVSASVITPAFNKITELLTSLYTADAVSTSFTPSYTWANAVITSSDIPTYRDYTIQKATDNDENTYFWWNGASVKDSFVMLDLGEVTNIKNIILKAAAGGNKDDYFHSGQIQYSQDGENWTDIGGIQTQPVVLLDNLDIKARYIRYTCMEDQIYWLCLSEFLVNYTVQVSSISATPEGEVERGIDKLFDGDLATYYRPMRTPQVGEAININIKNLQAKKLEIFGREISGADLTVCLSDGSEKSIGKPDNNYFSAEIPENTVIIKITWTDNSTVPEINEIILS